MYTDFKPTSLLDSGLGDMEEYNKQLQAQMAQRQAMEQQAQPQQRQAQDTSQGTDNVSFLEKLAMTIVPQSYQNINNVSTQRRNQANAPQAADYQALGEYWIDKDPQKAQQYLALADRQAKQRSESERTQRLQSVLGGVQGSTSGAPAVSGNAGYSEQAEQMARAGIQLMRQGDLEGGQELIKQADALNKLRTEGRETRLGNRVVNSDPYSIGQSLAIGVSPDANLSAETARRGQDITAGTAANRLLFDRQANAAKAADAGGSEQLVGASKEVAGSLSRVKNLLGKSGTTGVSGRVMSATGLPTNRKALEAELESLQSQLAFAEIARLKGLGVTFGALSDPERVAIGRSVANLDPNQPENALKAQLQRVYDKFQEYNPQVYQELGDMAVNEPSQNNLPSNEAVQAEMARRKKLRGGR